jgi:hypothetical protein
MACCSLVAAGADTIELVNGKSLRGKVVRREADRVVVNLAAGGRLTIPADRVLRVVPGNAGGAKPPKSPGPTAKPVKKPAPEKQPDPRVLRRVRALIAEMGVTEGDDAQGRRSNARDALVAVGEPAVAELCKALEDSVELRRWSTAVVLGRIRSKKSVRALLAAVYAGTPAKGKKAPWWEERYLRACGRSFKSVTGTSFDYDPDNVLAGAVAEKMLKWWVTNYEKYPVQIGEELVKPEKEGDEPKRPDPAKDIGGVAKRRYPKPVSRVRAR